MEDNKVKYAFGLLEDYERVQVKDPNTLYFILDKKFVMRGGVKFSAGSIDELDQKSVIEIYGGSATDNI